MNDWHHVVLTVTATGYRWTNQAGVSWGLNLQLGQDLHAHELKFDVTEECPYWKDGYKVAVMKSDEIMTEIFGPGNEPYTWIGKEESVNHAPEVVGIGADFSYNERLVMLAYF